MLLPKKVYPVYPENLRRKTRRKGFTLRLSKGFYNPVAILVLAAITLSVAIIFYLNSNVLFKAPKPTQSPASATSTSPSSNETVYTDEGSANWKTYRSAYGYSLKYPPNWEVKMGNWNEGTSQFGLHPADEVIIRFRDTQSYGGGPTPGTSLTLLKPKDNPNNLTALEWVKPNESKEFPATNEEITVQGIKAAKSTTIYDGVNIAIYIPYKDKMYFLNNHSFGNTESAKKTFDQILSTFRFE